MRRIQVLILIVLLRGIPSFGQNTYTVIGDAYGINDIVSPVCPDVDTCFTLTDDATGQAGAVWDDDPIDLSNSFDALFCLTLGSNDANGADGFAFVMRGINATNIGSVGGGIGYEGIVPSIGIEYDTWNNGAANDDIPEDHTGMYQDADFISPLVGAVSLNPMGTNVEDGNYHNTRIVWNAPLKVLEMYFDGDLRMSHSVDLINDVFGGDTLVFWGFTSSTGGSTNLQQICFPYTSIHVEDVIACYPDSAELSFYTDNITSYTWSSEAGDTLIDWNTIDYANPFDLNDTIVYISESGNYILDITFNNNNYSDTAEVEIVSLPVLPFQEDSMIYCPDKGDVTLDALNPGMNYEWSPPFPNAQIIVDNGYVGWYSVIITEPINSCFSIDSIYVENYCEPIVDFANVFTPNSDGVNDLYIPIFGVDPKWVDVETFVIRNRWGNIVYEYTFGNSVLGWDGMINGTAASEGTYFYSVTYSDIFHENTESKHGYLHLIAD
ncbi:MAG: gliding motility-associated C-terminal domain-containing protein [Crocinitomicaceae bacterium]|nr:gliding motility-associated C-terminal domain-containing protein [Crocinitomicaceae bacterium]